MHRRLRRHHMLMLLMVFPLPLALVRRDAIREVRRAILIVWRGLLLRDRAIAGGHVLVHHGREGGARPAQTAVGPAEGLTCRLRGDGGGDGGGGGELYTTGPHWASGEVGGSCRLQR
jgi:hypothetical protein